ncbi:protein of unknown function [Burkholderia multivorans]
MPPRPGGRPFQAGFRGACATPAALPDRCVASHDWRPVSIHATGAVSIRKVAKAARYASCARFCIELCIVG